MSKKDAIFFLLHIEDAINKIEEFSENISKDDFDSDDLRQSAIIRQVEILGEASKNLPIEFTKKYSKTPWQEMARMRDKLIHHYFGVDTDIVWKVLKDDLPALRKQIQEIIKKEKKN